MLTDAELRAIWSSSNPSNFEFMSAARAIESAACAERDKRIAELERKSDQDDETILWQAKEIADKIDRMVELERQLEEARKDAKPCPTCESLARAVMLDQTGKA